MAYDLLTVQELVVEYADFEQVNSVSRAKLFLTNANRWIVLQPDSQSNQGSSMAMSKQAVIDLMDRAREFINANDTSSPGGRVRFLGVGNSFR